MPKSFSIAKARRDLAVLVHQLDRQHRIELTHRGKPVAMLLSLREYNRLAAPAKRFWEAYSSFAETADLRHLGIEPEAFSNVRDRSGGNEANRGLT
jgi:prevent-host-death family protein